MNNFLSRLAVASVAALFIAGPALASGDKAAGQAKAKQVCGACHGENGNKPLSSDYPVLAGQYQDYLMKALHDYKSGARKNAIMAPQAQALSEKEIEDVTAWFSSQTTPLFQSEPPRLISK